jgi:hypothetical protein
MSGFAALGLSGIGAIVAALSMLLQFLKEYYRA